jgi:hypothetical protein
LRVQTELSRNDARDVEQVIDQLHLHQRVTLNDLDCTRGCCRVEIGFP